MTGIILVHGKAQIILERNMVTFNNWCDNYEFICPSDDPIVGYDNIFLSGLSQHNGIDTVERMRLACERASVYTSAVVLEYDTLLFETPPVPTDNIIYSCGPFPDNNPRFKSKWWSHSPWLTTQENFHMLSQCDVILLEKAFPDRWIAAACDECGIIPKEYSKWWSRNSIDTPQYESESIQAKKDGAIAIHGVKTEHVFNMLCN
jgi:hypothetical protein